MIQRTIYEDAVKRGWYTGNIIIQSEVGVVEEVIEFYLIGFVRCRGYSKYTAMSRINVRRHSSTGCARGSVCVTVISVVLISIQICFLVKYLNMVFITLLTAFGEGKHVIIISLFSVNSFNVLQGLFFKFFNLE